jgi:hypothetical protein
MSLILEALNRHRDSSEVVPTLATQHPVEALRPGVRQYVQWVVLAVAVALIAWLLWSRLGGEPATPAETGSPVAELTQNIGSAATSITTELKARAESREKGLQPPPVPSTPLEMPQQEVAAIAEALAAPVQVEPGQSAASPAEQVEPGPVEPPAKQAADVPASADAAPPAPEDPAVARLYRDRSVPEEPAAAPAAPAPAANREEQPVDIEDILKRARAESGMPEADDHPVPLLSSLSQQTKNEIPSVYYQLHDYSNNAAASRVTLNGKSVRVGGSPAPGLRVEEILPNSVVLNYRGTQFRLRALNSWINL